MANIKISQLPAKGANLASTDLVEISEFNGSGYVSKSITGQEIIDAASGGSGVTDVTATSPIASTGGTTPDISITQAGATDDGYLSTGDWNAFNSKQDALSSGVNIKTINGSSVLGSGDLTISGGTTGIHANFTLASGQFVSSVISSMSTQNGALVANTMYLVPFYPAQTITCSTLNISVSIAVAAAVCRILIYSESNGDPNIKLYESTNLDCSTTGVKSVATTFTFNAGTIYYLCVHSSAAISANIAPNTSLMPIPYRSSSALSAWNAFRLTAAIGSAPSPFSGGTLNSANNPIVIIQKA